MAPLPIAQLEKPAMTLKNVAKGHQKAKPCGNWRKSSFYRNLRHSARSKGVAIMQRRKELAKIPIFLSP
jgi:hypothetical protein